MTLSDDQIIELIKHPAHADVIERGCLLYKQHIRHIKGIGVEDFFKSQEIKGFENEEEKLFRHVISRATTVPIFASALGTFDKSYSASGYSRYFEFTSNSEGLQKDLAAYLSGNIGDGFNMSGWMQQVWGDKIQYDFNGVILTELPKETTAPKNKPYLIFKSIFDIYDYDADGISLDYIILHTKCEEEATKQNEENTFDYYRVIDDAKDLIVRVEKGKDAAGNDGYTNIVILNTAEYPIIPNIWKYVPGIIISSQKDAETEARQSFIWEAIGTADDYLLDSSIHTISKKKHGFPQKWSYPIPCKQCYDSTLGKSAGRFPIYGEYTSGERPIVGYTKCKDCNGQGSIVVSPSIAVLKPMPDAANPDIGEPFGYVVPDIDSMKMQTEELGRLEEIIHEAVWPVLDIHQTTQGADQTATGRVLDVSAKQTKLNKFSTNGEKIEQFLTDAIAKAIYGDAYKGSVVKWGRKYYILTENELEEMYKTAKEAGVNASILKSYLEELIYVRYATDPVELEKQLKLFAVEPFVHMTVTEVQSLQYAAISDKFMKTYFNDYIAEINRTKPDLIYVGTTEALLQELTVLNKNKMSSAKAEEPPKDPIVIPNGSSIHQPN
jgi:hypothetical protein